MQSSGFFNSAVGADGSYDRQYVAEQFAEYFASFVGNGVFQNKSDALMVTESDTPAMSVAVQTGQGWINGYWYKNSTELPLSVAISDGVLGRIDLVVMRLGFSERTIECVIKQGTAAATPVAPELQRDNDYYELALAQINVPAATVNIRNANIVDLRADASYCGFVQAAVQSIDTTYFGNQLNQFIVRYISQSDTEHETFVNTLETNTQEFEQRIQEEYESFEGVFQDLLERLRNLIDDDDALGRLVTELTTVENDVTTLQGNVSTLTTTVSNNYTVLDNDKENKYSKVTLSIAVSDWVQNSDTERYEYSFESQYPSTQYDIEVDLNWDTASDDQIKEWGKLQVVGSNAANKIVARSGEQPTLAQSVIIYVTDRS